MIQITVERQKLTEAIINVTIEGHAEAADPGEDVVCSAVSAISFCLFNAIEEILHVSLELESFEEEGGYLSFSMPIITDATLMDQVQLLLAAMVSSLRQIAEAYSDYVRITVN